MSKSSPNKLRHDGSTLLSEDTLSRFGLGGARLLGSRNGAADAVCDGGGRGG